MTFLDPLQAELATTRAMLEMAIDIAAGVDEGCDCDDCLEERALMEDGLRTRAEVEICPTCGKPAHRKHFLGACGPVSTWPSRPRANEGSQP